MLEAATGIAIPRGQPLRLDNIECLRMGTTVATNALLERKGMKSALLTTKGFKDLLRIGNQARPNIFDLSARRPDVLFEEVVEVDERVIPSHPRSSPDALASFREIEGIDGEKYYVVQELDTQKLVPVLQALKDKDYGSVATALINSFACPEHELKIDEIAKKMGFSVALSSQLQPMIKVVPRGMSATADAYLTPVIKTYIDSISTNFEGGLARSHGCRVEFMQSDGGLVDFRKFSGLKAILSGPAAGSLAMPPLAGTKKLVSPSSALTWAAHPPTSRVLVVIWITRSLQVSQASAFKHHSLTSKRLRQGVDPFCRGGTDSLWSDQSLHPPTQVQLAIGKAGL